MATGRELLLLAEAFSVCTVRDYSLVDLEQAYCFAGSTDEEKSLVCCTSHVPANTVARDDGWKCLRIQGVLDFSLPGILAELARVLAQAQVGILAISTYRTDYILIRQENVGRAVQALTEAGYQITCQPA